MLPAELHFTSIRSPHRVFRQRDRDRERLAVSHHLVIAELFDLRERVPRSVPPRHQQPCPSVRRGGRDNRQQCDRDAHRHARHDATTAMLWTRHRIAEVPLRRDLSHLLHRRFAQRQRSSLLALAVNQFDNAQQLIPNARVLAGEQPRELFQFPLPPNPAMQSQRDQPAPDHRRHKDAQPHLPRRVEHSVQHKRGEKGDQDADDGPTNRLDQLDRPHAPTKVEQLRLQRFRQGQPMMSKTHGSLLR